MVLTYLKDKGQAFDGHKQHVTAIFPLLAPLLDCFPFLLNSFHTLGWSPETASTALLYDGHLALIIPHKQMQRSLVARCEAGIQPVVKACLEQ